MQPLGIPAANLPDYHRAIRGDGVVEVGVDVLDLDGGHIGDIDALVQKFQILVDRHGKVKRALRIRFDDPSGSIDFAPDSPNPTNLFFSHMVRVSVSVFVPELADVVTAIPFTGPVTVTQRNEASVYVEAHSKDALARIPPWEPVTLKKGTPKDEAIRSLLDATGETQYALPDMSGEVLRRPLSTGRFGNCWALAESIAASMELQLRPRGDGYIDARPLPTTPVWTFATADSVDDPTEADVIGKPRVRRSSHGVVNLVEVLGPMPRAGQQRIRGFAVAPDEHDLSPVSLIRGGRPGYRPKQIVLPQLRSNADAQAIADRILDDALLSGVSPKFEASPVYPLDEGDIAVLQTCDTTVPFRLDQFSLEGARMSVGHHQAP